MCCFSFRNLFIKENALFMIIPYDASIPTVCNKKNHPVTLGLSWVICLHSCFPAFIAFDASSSRELSFPNLFRHRQIRTATMSASHSYEFKAISSRFHVPAPISSLISNFTLQTVSSTVLHPPFYMIHRRQPKASTIKYKNLRALIAVGLLQEKTII